MNAKLVPNFTQIPNVILEEWLPVLSLSEFKVVMLIARKTYGWQKGNWEVGLNVPQQLSVPEIVELTNLGRSTVIAACNSLEKKGYIICFASNLPNGHKDAAPSYLINLENVPAIEDDDGTADGECANGTDGDGTSQTGDCKNDPSKNQTRPDFRPVQNLDPSKNQTPARPDFGRVDEGRPVQNLDPHIGVNKDKAANKAGRQGRPNRPSTDKSTKTASHPAASGAMSVKAFIASLPATDVNLLDYDENDLTRLKDVEPSELVRRFRAQYPAFAERMARKSAQATTSPNKLLAHVIVSDYLPELRQSRAAAELGVPIDGSPSPRRKAQTAEEAEAEMIESLTQIHSEGELRL